MKNVIENDIKSSTRYKGYIHGFQEFADIVRMTCHKLVGNRTPLVHNS